ncbi:hypothetical protein [Paraburkholderia aspalathi]|uniref:Uncharacterized protein n=1 Tax=Paraburkholderia aspalathi TaxID=1324617 RepID=A0A1I7ADE0_9BURK|nr:hypothetical protein [Paraburkholderia aspalathi]SFT72883.1 hypothetical protein SAMN05192563_1003284 [Paraburkholderia aspalathi]
MSRVLLALAQPAGWPHELREYLDVHCDLFVKWQAGTGEVRTATYDAAIYGLIDLLQAYAMVGWHCTRLTEDEIAHVQHGGMQLPDGAMLRRRVERLMQAGSLTKDIALQLLQTNQADDSNRAGMIWFCFFSPRLAGESGIGRFFRHWGGEALYNSHESDPQMSSVLQRIGVPCLVEAEVPIVSIGRHGGLAFKVVRSFLMNRGLPISERTEHEDRIRRPLEADCVRRVIRFSERDFSDLTGCTGWHSPLC